MVARKAQAAVRNGLVLLVCIGEKSRSKIPSEGVGIATGVCIRQVMAVLDALPQDIPLMFAYEPVSAIGAQQPAKHHWHGTCHGSIYLQSWKWASSQ